MMEDLGLNPDDDQENYNTPVGIGNLCGNNVVRDRLDDGVNQVNINRHLKQQEMLLCVFEGRTYRARPSQPSLKNCQNSIF